MKKRKYYRFAEKLFSEIEKTEKLLAMIEEELRETMEKNHLKKR